MQAQEDRLWRGGHAVLETFRHLAKTLTFATNQRAGEPGTVLHY